MKSWLFKKEFPRNYELVFDAIEIADYLMRYEINNDDGGITAVAINTNDGEVVDLWYSIDNNPQKDNSIYEHFSTIIETEEFMLAENLIQVKSANGGRNLPFGSLE